MLKVSVVIPTYRRPKLLAGCLDALRIQTCQPDEVIVVYRENDFETETLLETLEPFVSRVAVNVPGQVAALQAGVAASSGDVVAFLDDDAVPRSNWVQLVEQSLIGADIGAVGGRDIVHQEGGSIVHGSARVVGRLSWYGKPIGNHHLGIGAARNVDFLKGCNAAYRRDFLYLPIGLLRTGDALGNDMASALAVRRAGGRVVYDPRIIVDHYPGQKFDGLSRLRVGLAADRGVYNLSFIVNSLTSWSYRVRYLGYYVLVGDSLTPGIVRAVVALFRNEEYVRGRLVSAQRALLRGFYDAVCRPLEMWSAEAP